MFLGWLVVNNTRKLWCPLKSGVQYEVLHFQRTMHTLKVQINAALCILSTTMGILSLLVSSFSIWAASVLRTAPNAPMVITFVVKL